jgi:hypothetical protein
MIKFFQKDHRDSEERTLFGNGLTTFGSFILRVYAKLLLRSAVYFFFNCWHFTYFSIALEQFVSTLFELVSHKRILRIGDFTTSLLCFIVSNLLFRSGLHNLRNGKGMLYVQIQDQLF